MVQFALPKRFVCKVILACHDDNGQLGVERTLGLVQERFFLAQNGRGHVNTYLYL